MALFLIVMITILAVAAAALLVVFLVLRAVISGLLGSILVDLASGM